MTTNNHLLEDANLYQKADLALLDFTTNGKLLPQVAQQFLEIAVGATRLLPLASVPPMSSNEARIDTIEFQGYILRPGVEGEALPIGDRVKPTAGGATVVTKEFIAEVRMSYNTLEDTIERKNFQAKLVDMLGRKVGYDMEYTVVNSDTAYVGPYKALKLFDGIRKLAVSHTVDIGGAPLDEDQILKIVKKLDNKYQQNPAQLKILTSPKAKLDYAHRAFISRGTPLGDSALTRPVPVTYVDREVVDVPAFPENLGGGTNETEAIYCDPKNVTVGMWREVAIELDKDISARQLIIVATFRMGCNYANEDGVVKGYGITIS